MSVTGNEVKSNTLKDLSSSKPSISSSRSHSSSSSSPSPQKLLTDVQLKRLKDHKYSSTNIGLLDPLFQPYWNWLTNQLPLWLAPNLLTTIGMIINVVTSLILLYHTPDLKQSVPKWACFLCAVGIWIYQSLDAIDGKQARRTKSSSPLGELFDHGCDSFSTVFLTLNVVCSCQLGLDPILTFFHCMLGSLLFYCVHWRTFVTGTLHFGLVDVTEAEIAMIIVQLVSAILGSEFWTTPILSLVPWMTYGHVLIFTTSPFEIFSLVQTFKIVIGKYGAGKNGSTVAGTSVISPAIPILLALVPFIFIALWSEDRVYQNHPALFIMTFGLIASKVTDRLIIAHMTKSEMNLCDRVLIGPLLMLLNQIFHFGINEPFLLWCSLFLATFELFVYSKQICQEICSFLHIHLFRI